MAIVPDEIDDYTEQETTPPEPLLCYSALSMAAALPEDGRIDTCEVDERHAEVARRYIPRSRYADLITVHVGPALGTIERLDREFDFVRRDA